MIAKIVIAMGLVASAGLLYIFTTTSPAESGALGVLAVFFLSYLFCVSFLTIFLVLCHRLVLRLFFAERVGRVDGGTFTHRRSYYYSSVLALGPVIIVSLQSVGKLGIAEVMLVVALLVVGCLYVSRQT